MTPQELKAAAAVMLEAANNPSATVEYRTRSSAERGEPWHFALNPVWDWGGYVYRIRKQKSLGQIAYEANGGPPNWDQLGDEWQRRWQSVADAVLAEHQG
jgi:hypothetical protein